MTFHNFHLAKEQRPREPNFRSFLAVLLEFKAREEEVTMARDDDDSRARVCQRSHIDEALKDILRMKQESWARKLGSLLVRREKSEGERGSHGATSSVADGVRQQKFNSEERRWKIFPVIAFSHILGCVSVSHLCNPLSARPGPPYERYWDSIVTRLI